MKNKIYVVELTEQRYGGWIVNVWDGVTRLYPAKPREEWEGKKKEWAREEGASFVERIEPKAQFIVREVYFSLSN